MRCASGIGDDGRVLSSGTSTGLSRTRVSTRGQDRQAGGAYRRGREAAADDGGGRRQASGKLSEAFEHAGADATPAYADRLAGACPGLRGRRTGAAVSDPRDRRSPARPPMAQSRRTGLTRLLSLPERVPSASSSGCRSRCAASRRAGARDRAVRQPSCASASTCRWRASTTLHHGSGRAATQQRTQADARRRPPPELPRMVEQGVPLRDSRQDDGLTGRVGARRVVAGRLDWARSLSRLVVVLEQPRRRQEPSKPRLPPPRPVSRSSSRGFTQTADGAHHGSGPDRETRRNAASRPSPVSLAASALEPPAGRSRRNPNVGISRASSSRRRRVRAKDDVEAARQPAARGVPRGTGARSTSATRSKNLTPYDVLIIASMVEKEVQVPKERRLVGGSDLQPSLGGHVPRHRRDHPLRPRPSRRRSRPGAQLESDAVQHVQPTWACRRRRSRTRGSRRCRRSSSANVDYLFFVRKPDKRTASYRERGEF